MNVYWADGEVSFVFVAILSVKMSTENTRVNKRQDLVLDMCIYLYDTVHYSCLFSSSIICSKPESNKYVKTTWYNWKYVSEAWLSVDPDSLVWSSRFQPVRVGTPGCEFIIIWNKVLQHISLQILGYFSNLCFCCKILYTFIYLSLNFLFK